MTDNFPEAIFDFTDSTWVEIIWYVTIDGGDLLACVFRELPNGLWQLRFRTRDYADDKRVWGSDDDKRIWDATATREDDQKAVKAKFIESADLLTREWATLRHGELHRLVVRGHAEKALKLLSRQPWTHQKQLTFPKTSRVH